MISWAALVQLRAEAGAAITPIAASSPTQRFRTDDVLVKWRPEDGSEITRYSQALTQKAGKVHRTADGDEFSEYAALPK